MNSTLLVKRATVATLKKSTFWRESRDGNGAGWGRRKGSSFPPRMTGKILLPHPRPLGPCKTPPHLVKLYFLLICLTTSKFFLMKPISLIKIYLKLQLNLSHQIKSIFRKN